MDTGQRLKDLGFTFAGTCNCNGSHNRKYKRAEYLIYITSSKYKVKRNGSTVKGYTDIEGLQEYIQKTFQIVLVGEQVQDSTGV